MKKREKRKEGSNKDAPKSIDRDEHDEIRTERPFGEKDEVKRAEDKLRNAGKSQ
jgi:hypothetical protein